MLHNQDWSATDFEALPPDAIPVTAYKPAGRPSRYDAHYTHWGDAGSRPATTTGSRGDAWRRTPASAR